MSRDGTVEAVDGGAPRGWITRRIDECAGLPEHVRGAARKLVRDLAKPLAGSLVRRVRVAPSCPGDPSFTLLTVEAVLLRPAEVELARAVRRALEPLLRQAEAIEVSLRIDVAPDMPETISVDAAKITWAVTAVVGNALRYVRRGGRVLPGGTIGVVLGYNAVARMVSITVEDDGRGIPADVQARLLAPDPGGDATGVSLPLVRDVVAAHGGGMVIKSSTEPADHGTAVTLWLPVRG